MTSVMYKSKQGDVGTQEYWVNWFYNSFNYAVEAAYRTGDFPKPTDGWERVQRLLKLEQIDK